MRAVLWDLDDTLLDTLPARMRSLKHACERCLGEPVDPLELWRSHRGGSLEALGQRLLGPEAPRFVEAYRRFYYQQPERHTVFPGIEEVLTALSEHGLALAVVTSKISWGATEELERAGLLQYFGAVVGCDDAEQAKPDPAPIYEALNRIAVDDPGQVLFVGDSPADMFAARNAGCVAVAATWGTIDRELLLDTAPGFVAQQPADVLVALSAALRRQP
jgi:HAD superfamily hydrolase (TIGR01509 family)